MKTLNSHFTKFILMSAIIFGGLVATPLPAQAGGSDIATLNGIAGSDNASVQFGNLQGKLKGFAVVVLLIMLVVAGIMAAMQKVQMAINIAIAAIILFGGAYIIQLLASGLGASGNG